MGLGLGKLFKHGLPIGKLTKKLTDVDETAEEALDKLEVRAAVMTDVVMARAIGNLIELGEAVLAGLKDWYGKRIAESEQGDE